MNESKHTPGPWSVPHFAQPDTNCDCGYVLTDDLMGAVATVHCSGEGDDWLSHGDNPRFAEAVANAHLISAAPLLYDALVAALAVVDARDQIARIDRSGYPREAEREALERLCDEWLSQRREALLKAAPPAISKQSAA
jgi:hypothetical protein